MNGEEVNLTQMMKCRENRVKTQIYMLKKYNCPLISFSMNIPGPIKTNELILSGFEAGKISLLKKLNQENFLINESLEIHEITGDEILLSIKNAKPEQLKKITLEIENSSSIGRLFDMDVINSNGEKLSRQNFRKCLICEKQAQECSRSRTHSINEMQITVEKILKEGLL